MITESHPAFPIVRAIALVYGLDARELFDFPHARPTLNVSQARALAWLALRTRYRWSYPEIAKAFDADHTSIMVGVRKATARVNDDPKLCAEFQRIVREA